LANNADEDHKDENDGEDDEDDSDVDSEEYATSLPKEITNIFYLDGSYFFLMFFGV
jgi:hypothetical protein